MDIYKNESYIHFKNQICEYEGECLYLLPNGKGKMEIKNIGYIEATF